ncbi:MAG: abc-f [Bacillales bacterium]|jgi:macrolide transport system ATP-binding/permease protein|nr:abc-f [Bacillales bacterium]
MKELIKLHNVSYEIQNYKVFEGINASIQQGDIIGIIGKNGAGKSTLLKLISNDLVPTQGHLQCLENDLSVVRLEQETESHLSNDVTVFEVELLEKWYVPTHDFGLLSGGEKLKARLANGFAKNAHIFMLDEPTNHLDERSTELLIEQIKHYNGTIILVSHDRYFLDEIAKKIWSLEGNQLIEHEGNYSSYIDVREHRRLTQQREYEKQKKKIERIEEQINELTSWSKEAHAQSTKQEGFKEYYRVKAKRMDSQVKSKQKRLENELKYTKVDRVEPEYTVHFSIESNNKLGKRFLEATNLTKSFDERILFKNVNFTILHGEKIAIVGPNGSGKSTLLKIIMGQEQTQGNVWISPSANIGYLTQEVFDLPLDKTPKDLFNRDTFEARGKVQNLMKHLGFNIEQWTEPIRNMSMGERVKCKLMVYILEEKDVLILDEPTNHLDLLSREQLENTLAQYNGTLLVVSHDRYFLEKITESRLVISNKKIQKQWNEAPQKRDDKEELRMKLEADRQEVLGKLSFITRNDDSYAELDKRFLELTRQINSLSQE